MSSIRQPITTGGVYLFLEDGIPTRPSGFFNHNGLYEINLPQAERIEVIKGPGSALYGSDAIGGIINSITRVSPSNNELDVKVEHGEYRWKKALISAGAPLSEDTSFRLNLNLTDNEGWRDESQYTRSSNTLRFDTIFVHRVLRCGQSLAQYSCGSQMCCRGQPYQTTLPCLRPIRLRGASLHRDRGRRFTRGLLMHHL